MKVKHLNLNSLYVINFVVNGKGKREISFKLCSLRTVVASVGREVDDVGGMRV